MTNVEQILKEFGENVTRNAKQNLGASYKGRRIDNSGALRKSLDYNVKVSKTGNSFEFDIEMLEYGEWVDKGRLPGKGIPPKALLKWIRTKPIRLRDSKTGSFVKSSESKLKSLAFLINRKIKEHGIAATNFISEPFDKYFKTLPDDIIEAFGLDVEDMIEFSLKTHNKDYK